MSQWQRPKKKQGKKNIWKQVYPNRMLEYQKLMENRKFNNLLELLLTFSLDVYTFFSSDSAPGEPVLKSSISFQGKEFLCSPVNCCAIPWWLCFLLPPEKETTRDTERKYNPHLSPFLVYNVFWKSIQRMKWK